MTKKHAKRIPIIFFIAVVNHIFRYCGYHVISKSERDRPGHDTRHLVEEDDYYVILFDLPILLGSYPMVDKSIFNAIVVLQDYQLSMSVFQ